MTRTMSLAGVAAACAAMANVLAMAIYGAYEYLAGRAPDLAGLVLEHLGHVFVLAVVGYGTAWLVMRRLVVEPMRRAESHMYRIGAGALRPLQLRTAIRELRTLEHGVNLMLERMRMGVDEGVLREAEQDLESLEGLAQALPSTARAQAEELQLLAGRLHVAVSTLLHAGPAREAGGSEGRRV